MNHIERLTEDVINRIAAGEVVQRPSAALKELIENSLDANATVIQVTVQGGGLEVLQVMDDGDGIDPVDLPLLCERYATSKLRSFDDLSTIGSFGFRGEALASLSYVSHVIVTTRKKILSSTPSEASSKSTKEGTERSDVAWRGVYGEGKLISPPTPCASNYGTIIRSENMFYNAAVRRQALKPAEEWGRIMDVVTRYALAFPHVGFTCRKLDGSSGGSGGGASNQMLSLPKQSSLISNIRLVYGNTISSHLRFIYYDTFNSQKQQQQGEQEKDALDDSQKEMNTPGAAKIKAGKTADDEVLSQVERSSKSILNLRGAEGEGKFSIVGYTSDSTLTNRKFYLCLFINNRLVESSSVKRAIDAVYASALTGGNRPFTVIKLTVPPDRLDVNIHPTKKEVCMLDEEIILGCIAEILRGALLESASERQLDTMKLQRTAIEALKDASHNIRLSSGAGSENDGNTPYGSNNNSSSQSVLENLQRQVANGSWQLRNAVPNTVAGKAVMAPCTMVRVDQQKGALDSFFRSKNSPTITTFKLGTNSSSSLPTTSDSKEELSSTNEEVTSQEVDLDKVLLSIQNPGVKKEKDEEKLLLKRGSSDMEDTETEDDIMADFKRFKKEVTGLNAKFVEEDTNTSSKLQTFASLSDFAEQRKDETDLGTNVTTEIIGEVQKNSSSSGNGAENDGDDEVLCLESYTLSSVEAIVHHIHRASTSEAKHFIQDLSFVGVVDEGHFLGQYGNTLLLLNTLHLVREVVYQRIFLRWADPFLQEAPFFKFSEALSISQLLYFTLERDVNYSLSFPPHSGHFFELLEKQIEEKEKAGGLHKIGAMKCKLEDKDASSDNVKKKSGTSAISPGRRKALVSESKSLLFDIQEGGAAADPLPLTRKYVKYLVRKLIYWREMLEDYFHIIISEDGLLLGLPYGLNDSWPPAARAVPLFLWQLAETVPFPTTESDAKVEEGDEFAENSVKRAEEICESEKRCFDAVARCISNTLFGLVTPLTNSSIVNHSSSSGSNSNLEDFIKFGLFPCMKMKKFFLPPAGLLMEGGGSVSRIVTVESLYKVFERC